MTIVVIDKPIDRAQLLEIAKERYGDLVKVVVDIEKKVMAIGGELHVDEESLLMAEGSLQQNLWGINIYPLKVGEDFIEFDSVINLRPRQSNFIRGVSHPEIRQKITEVVQQLVLDYDKILS